MVVMSVVIYLHILDLKNASLSYNILSLHIISDPFENLAQLLNI